MTPPLDPQTVRQLLAGRYPVPVEPVQEPDPRQIKRQANLAIGLTMEGKPRKRAIYSPWTSLAGLTQEQRLQRRREQSRRAMRAMRKATL